MNQPAFVPSPALARILKESHEAWQRREFDKSIELLEGASRREPANVHLLMHLGRCHGQRYNYEAAQACFEKAIRLTPNKGHIFSAAGSLCRDFSQPKMAETFLRQALEQKDAPPVTSLQLAEICERLRQPDQASEFLNRFLQTDPAFPPALLLRAKLERQAGQLDEAEKTLRSFLPTPHKETCLRGWYELGGVLDQQKRYREAMTAFLQAKALAAAEGARALDELKQIRTISLQRQAVMSAEMFQRWRAAAPELPPARRLAVLCGHPRSGTTLLEQVLDSHPDIVSAEETTIFNDDAYVPLARSQPPGTSMANVLESATNPALQKVRADYLRVSGQFIGQPVGARLLIDKNPAINFMIPAFVRIFPEVKFLVAIRDPRDVCLSCFMQPIWPINPVNSAYLDLGTTADEYVAMMGRWTSFAPMLEGTYLQVRYEDMVEDLESSARRTLEFLNIPWDETVLRFNERAGTKAVRSPTYADVSKPVFKRAVGRWHNYEEFLAPHLSKLEPFAKAFGYE